MTGGMWHVRFEPREPGDEVSTEELACGSCWGDVSTLGCGFWETWAMGRGPACVYAVVGWLEVRKCRVSLVLGNVCRCVIERKISRHGL